MIFANPWESSSLGASPLGMKRLPRVCKNHSLPLGDHAKLYLRPFFCKMILTLFFHFPISVGEFYSPCPLEKIPKDQMNLEPKTIKASDLKSRSRSSSITDTPTSSYRMQRSHSLSRFVLIFRFTELYFQCCQLLLVTLNKLIFYNKKIVIISVKNFSVNAANHNFSFYDQKYLFHL